MNPETPRPRLRGFSLHAARAAALLISIGVVTLVALNAGIGGCRATAPGIQADNPPRVQGNAAAPPGADETSESASEQGEFGYMGGAKAPAGNWARPPRKPSPQAPSPQAPSPQAPSPQAPSPQAPTPQKAGSEK